jgi:hypothetical protein
MGLGSRLSKCTSPSQIAFVDEKDFLMYISRAECRIISAADKFAFVIHTLGLKWED